VSPVSAGCMVPGNPDKRRARQRGEAGPLAKPVRPIGHGATLPVAQFYRHRVFRLVADPFEPVRRKFFEVAAGVGQPMDLMGLFRQFQRLEDRLTVVIGRDFIAPGGIRSTFCAPQFGFVFWNCSHHGTHAAP
jgi:hypothetical protein